MAFRRVILTLLLILSTNLSVRAEDGGIIFLDDATFDIVTAKGLHIVFFGATWCPHCVRLTPVWGNLTEKVADLREKDVAHVEKVECTTSEGLCQRMNLAGYPSVVVFRNGKRGEMYQGSRSLEDLERFVRAKAASDAPVAVAGDSHDESHEDNTVEDEEIEEEHAEEDKGEDHDPEEEAAPPVPVPIPPAVPAVPPPKPAREAPPKHEQPKPAAEAPRHEQPNRKSDLPKVIREDIQRTCDKLYKSETPMAPSDGKAKMLTAASFDELVKTGSTFVKFYAPWCGHCQRLQPTWESLASHPKIQGKVNIGKVDCTVEHQLCRRFGVKSFPQLKFFQKNDVVDFRGARTTEGLVAFSHAQLDVPLQPLHALELREAMKSHDLHFVLLYSRYEAAVDVMSHFIRIAKRFRPKAIFHVSSDVDLLRTLDPKSSPSDLPRVYVVRGGDPKNTPHYCGQLDFEPLLKWVGEKMETVLQELNEGSSATLLDGQEGKLVLLGLLDPKQDGDRSFLIELRKASERIASQTNAGPRVVVAWMDAARFADYAGKVYGYTKGMPKAIVLDPANDRFFDTDATGAAFGMAEGELVWAANAAQGGKLKGRYTDNFLVRTMKRFSKLTQGLGSLVMDRPVLAFASIAVIFAIAVWFLILDGGSSTVKTGKAE